MAEAAPAVVGMPLPGVALHGAGTYRGYRSLQKLQMTDAVEEYKRETEKDMVSALLEQRDRNNLYKKSPEVYGKTIQAQMERSGKETLYIDAASVAETEEGRAALSELSEKNIVSSEDVQNAVTNGTPLEVRPGVYMQEVTQETADIISDNATFDKGGRTLAAIQKAREHYKNVMAKWEEAAAEREAAAVDAFIDEILPSRQKGEDFLAGSDIEEEQIALREKERAILKEILAEDIAHPLDALKRAEEKAREEFYDVTGTAEEKANYIRHHGGTVEIIQDFRVQQYQNVKVSSNDGWYSKLYKKLGKKPTIRDAEDAAYDEAYQQADAAGDTEWKAALKAAKERRDVLYSLRGVIESIDTQDLAARASLSQEAYHQIYAPVTDTLKGANPEVLKAAKDSALLLARQADIFHAVYGTSYEDAVRVILGDRAETGASVYNMATHDMRKDGIQTAGEFYEEVQKYRANNEDVNKIRFTSPSGVVYLGSNMNHVEIGSHQLGKEQYDDMDSHIELMRDVHLAFRGKKLMGQYGIPFVGRVVGEKESYYVVIEIDPKSGGIFFITGLSRKPEAISNMLKKDIKITEEAIKNGKIDSQIHTKLSAGPLGNQSFREISIQELKEKVKALVRDDPIYGQMAGLNAVTAPVAQLRIAEQMERDGSEAQEIWDKTGWMRGPEGEWRFEIPDLPEQIDIDLMQTVSRALLSRLYKNSKLYEAYPFLKNISVIIESFEGEDKGTKGFSDDKSIHIGKEELAANPEKAKRTLIHEIQHIIQNAAEPGFSKGGSVETAKAQMQNTLKDLQNALADERSRSADVDAYVKASEALSEVGDFAEISEINRLMEEKENIGEKLDTATREGVDRKLNQIDELQKALAAGSDYAAYRRLGGEAEAFMVTERAESKSSEMPNYDTGYGAAVVNFGGEILPFYEQQAPAAAAKFSADEKAWADALDHLSERKGKPVRVMQTPLVMQLGGIKNLPIYMDISKIQNILGTHSEMTTDVLKKIPRALTDPVMITYSNSTNDRIIVILDLKAENEVPVIVPFELEVRKNAVMANVITSAYTKTKEENGKVRPNYEWVREHAGAGLLYVNREKVPAALGMSKQKAMSFLSPAGVQFPMGRKQHSSLTVKIPDESDLVKLREENAGQYQRQGARYAGQYSEAENLIRVFSAGNASTVMHESAHAWLSMLERLVKDEADKRGITGTTDEILAALSSDPSVGIHGALQAKQSAVYASKEYNEFLLPYIVRSMSRAGIPTDNAAMEAINGWIKAELFMDLHVTGKRSVKKEIADYIVFFNKQRPSYTLNYMTPVEYRLMHAPADEVQD